MIGRVVRYAIIAALTPAAALAQTAKKAPVPRPPAVPPAAVHLMLAPTGNEARYTVHEQLMTAELPIDAIGVTKAIAGGLTIGPNGKIDPASSTITVRMDSLATDNAHRDSWVREHTLRTDSFPTASYAVKELQGFPAKLPTSGTFTVKMIGDLTVHGVTKPWTWDLTLTANGNEYTGRATTHLKFADFGMEQPRLLIVVSVVDDVKLEYDFHFVKSTTK